jgi:23S rRNA (uracil1939-C5)-methyltransferase
LTDDAQTTVAVTGIAAGGDGVGRLPDDRVVFVRGAIPGDRVRLRVDEERARFARGTVLDVVEPGPGRAEPPCPLVAEGCGGCGWQHVDPAHQRSLKASIVVDALVRVGRLDAGSLPEVDLGPVLPAGGHRTTVRAAVVDGRAGLRRHHAHDVVDVSAIGCLVAHPLVDEVLRTGRFGSHGEVVVRAGSATGERLVVLHGGQPRGADDDDDVTVPAGTNVVTEAELRGGRRVWLHEEVAGRRWRISASSFFQTRPAGAEDLGVAVASGVAAGPLPADVRVTDLYGGVGLLAGAVADRLRGEARVQLVEANRGAVADARVNLADVPGARVVRADVRRWHPSRADIVVADPSRHGLGAPVVERIAATGARTVVLVSCDPGALGRDAGDLVRSGYAVGGIRLVDMFPHTPHVEVVTTWRRAAPP